MLRRLTPAVIAITLALAAPAFAVDTSTSKNAPDLSAPRARIVKKDWSGAIADLNGMVDKGVQHADLYNLLGYSYRKNGELNTASVWYRKALEFDPNHKGALEYLGELYVQIGDMPKAKDNMARLEKLCPSGCEELEDLRKAIAAAPSRS